MSADDSEHFSVTKQRKYDGVSRIHVRRFAKEFSVSGPRMPRSRKCHEEPISMAKYRTEEYTFPPKLPGGASACDHDICRIQARDFNIERLIWNSRSEYLTGSEDTQDTRMQEGKPRRKIPFKEPEKQEAPKLDAYGATEYLRSC